MAFWGHIAYAFIITTLYTYSLSGPLLLGLRDVGTQLVVTGLGGYAGSSGAIAILTALSSRSRKWELVFVSIFGAVLACASAIMYLLHQFYFGSKASDSTIDYVIYFLSIFILSALMRGFMAAVKRAGVLIAKRS